MAENFKISIHKNSENMHIKLFGDFDGNSAHELINALKNKTDAVSKIFIHTNSLNHIYPFGKQIFRNNLDFLNNKSFSVFFTGESAVILVPKNNKFLKRITC